MTRHYQLMKYTEEDGETWYGVHKVYEATGFTGKPEIVMGRDVEGIKWMLEAMLKDIEKHGVKDYE